MFLLEKFSSLFIVQNSEVKEDPASHDEGSNEELTIKKDVPKSTYLDGIAHMFRATVGTGVLSLPMAFSQSGYVLGAIGVVFVTYLSLYCATTLAKCQLIHSRKDKTVVPSFQGSMVAAFKQGPENYRRLAPFVVRMTNIFLIVGQIGGVCVYFVFVATNIKAAAEPLVSWDVRVWTALIGVPILCMNMVLSLRGLSLISSLGNAILLSSIAIIFYYIFREPLSLEGRRPFGDFMKLPSFFGTVFFASAYLNMVLPLQSEMEKPEEMSSRCGVLSMNAHITGALHLVFGFLGYLRFGDESQDTVTLNLPDGMIATAVQLLLALSLMTATALQNYITMTIIWDDYLEKKITRNKKLAKYLLSAGNVLTTLAISVSVPYLGLLVSICGILGQVLINTALPCLIHFLTSWSEQSSTWDFVREFWMDVVAIVFSLLILASSAHYVAMEVIDIIHKQ